MSLLVRVYVKLIIPANPGPVLQYFLGKCGVNDATAALNSRPGTGSRRWGELAYSRAQSSWDFNALPSVTFSKHEVEPVFKAVLYGMRALQSMKAGRRAFVYYLVAVTRTTTRSTG